MIEVFDVLDEYILMTNKYGDVKYINQRLLDKLGYKLGEIKNIDKILSDIDIKGILTITNYKKIDLNLLSKNNNIVETTSDISVENYMDEDVILIISKDISEKYYKKEDLETILDQAQFLAWIKDIDGKYIYSNKYFEIHKNQNKEFMLGKTDKDIWNTHEKYDYSKEDMNLIEGNRSKLYEHIFELEDKKKLYFETKKYPIKENNKIKYIVATSEDITSKKNLELEIKKNYEAMSTLYDILNGNNKVDLYEFLYNRMEGISNLLNLDGLTLLLYDSEKKVLIPKVKLGNSNIAYKNKSEIKFDEHDYEKHFSRYSEGIRPIVDLINDENRNCDVPEKVGYFGYYNIMLNDEFIGIIGFSYNYDNTPISEIDNFMKIICIEIGMLIKNYNLYKNINTELEKSKEVEESIDLFLKTATDHMCIVDKLGNFVKVGPKWPNTLGWNIEELQNMNILDIIHPDDCTCIFELCNIKLKDKELRKLRSRCLCKNGKYKWLDYSFRFIEEDQQYILAAQDITEEIKLEQENKSLEESVHLESIKNEFFANISHEFKTPINIILGIMQLLDSKIVKGDIYSKSNINLSSCIKSIKQNSYRLLRLVNNLIDITRIDTGFYEIQLGNYNIIKIIEDITMSVTDYIKDKGINIIFDTEVEELVTACDPDKIERIMLNLLSNAIKYSSANSEINVYIKYESKNITVSVRDNGLGISEEKIDLIFERFGQANYCLTRPCEGSGIGLSLVKELVELHGGEVSVKSKENKGSEFYFKIPNKLIKGEAETILDDKHLEFQREKCNIEFSDIYTI